MLKQSFDISRNNFIVSFSEYEEGGQTYYYTSASPLRGKWGKYRVNDTVSIILYNKDEANKIWWNVKNNYHLSLDKIKKYFAKAGLTDERT